MSKKIKEDKIALKVPKDIRELAQGFRKERIEKEQAERLAKQKREAENKRVRVARLKTGLEYATKIFLWAKALKESDIVQELMKKSYSNLFFFNGHIAGTEKVSLGISPNGLFWRNSGKGYSNQQVFSPENLAESVETIILESASVWIDDGEVWHCIKRRFDYLQDK